MCVGEIREGVIPPALGFGSKVIKNKTEDLSVPYTGQGYDIVFNVKQQRLQTPLR